MPARDRFHQAVRHALEKDGWVITHDPLRLDFGQEDAYIDLGAERMIAAERGEEKIAVEIKSFLEHSRIHAMELAAGQYVFYRALLRQYEPARSLILALPHSAYLFVRESAMAQILVEAENIRLVSFDPEAEEIMEWKS